LETRELVAWNAPRGQTWSSAAGSCVPGVSRRVAQRNMAQREAGTEGGSIGSSRERSLGSGISCLFCNCAAKFCRFTLPTHQAQLTTTHTSISTETPALAPTPPFFRPFSSTSSFLATRQAPDHGFFRKFSRGTLHYRLHTPLRRRCASRTPARRRPHLHQQSTSRSRPLCSRSPAV